MKTVLIGLLCLAMFAGVVFLTINHSETTEPTLYNYFTRSQNDKTGAQNIVAAILLNYRMYDTVFEAMILLTSVMGMLHFLYAGHKAPAKKKGPDKKDSADTLDENVETQGDIHE
jgi:multisubunit Na+/H+ antiporter MnhB subunit